MEKDVENMSEEEKKKYLEDLRKELDPEILSKMAEHMGAGPVMDAGSIPSTGNTGSSSAGGSKRSYSTPADEMKERRAMRFQERVAQRKREMEIAATEQQSEEPQIDRKVAVLSSTEIWSRIVENQFKSLNFNQIQTFYDFHSLIKFLVDCFNKGCMDDLVIAIAVKEMNGFSYLWKKLRSESNAENRLKFLDYIPYFVIIESQKQVQDNNKMDAINPDQILSLTDDVETNKEKIARIMMQFKEYRKRGES